ncbi:helix-turn-helix domain-containing protein [Aeromicrobium endophyticum]|uniref:XRE family transcriptional regulator n=1 Tax=Aeromicrobium endophyticum TaxID=2292704 RepID=A0A371PCM5_9ACTN|nr:helix-turn-helix transcriptional regulator [Aeromicrobium endophyticum]REK73682.1 XRE family transcriptional regulator [Aeromicrobium endophyticum]
MDRNERAAWGPRIRLARVRAGMRQEELAAKAGTTTRTLGSIERGDSVGQASVIGKLIDALGLETSQPALDPEVEVLVAMIGELLQQTPAEARPGVAREIVLLLTTALGAAHQGDTPGASIHQFPAISGTGSETSDGADTDRTQEAADAHHATREDIEREAIELTEEP